MFFVGSQNEAQLESSPRLSEASGWPTGKQAAPGNHWSTGLYRPCHQDSTLFNSLVCSCIFPTYIAMIDMYTSIL